MKITLSNELFSIILPVETNKFIAWCYHFFDYKKFIISFRVLF